MRTGVGWTPANLSITPLGVVAEETPFGAVGDLRLLPDAETHVRLAGAPGESAPRASCRCDDLASALDAPADDAARLEVGQPL